MFSIENTKPNKKFQIYYDESFSFSFIFVIVTLVFMFIEHCLNYDNDADDVVCLGLQ